MTSRGGGGEKRYVSDLSFSWVSEKLRKGLEECQNTAKPDLDEGEERGGGEGG